MSFSQTDHRFSNNFSEGLLYFMVKFSILNSRGDPWQILEAGQRDLTLDIICWEKDINIILVFSVKTN